MEYKESIAIRYHELVAIFNKNREYLLKNGCNKIDAIGSPQYFHIRVYHKKDSVEFYEKAVDILQDIIAKQEDRMLKK